MNFEDVSHIGKCEVCGTETQVAVVSSSLGPYSSAYCKECLNRGLEPYKSIIAYLFCTADENTVLEYYNVNSIVMQDFYKKSCDEFLQDWKDAVDGYEDYIHTLDVVNSSPIPVNVTPITSVTDI